MRVRGRLNETGTHRNRWKKHCRPDKSSKILCYRKPRFFFFQPWRFFAFLSGVATPGIEGVCSQVSEGLSSEASHDDLAYCLEPRSFELVQLTFLAEDSSLTLQQAPFDVYQQRTFLLSALDWVRPLLLLVVVEVNSLLPCSFHGWGWTENNFHFIL